MVKIKIKRPTYMVWRNPPKGDDDFRTFRSIGRAAAEALKLSKKNQLNDVTIAVGRSKERMLTKPEKKKFRTAVKKIKVRRR